MRHPDLAILSLCLIIASTSVAQPVSPAEDVPQFVRELKVFTNAGTTDRLAKFASDGTTTVNSALYESGGWVGINTTAPWRILTVNLGSVPDNGFRIVREANTNPVADLMLVTSAAAPYAYLQIGDSITYRALSLQPYGGNVGIRTSTPSAPLHVYAPATTDAYMSFGVDAGTGPALNIGHGGGSFGKGGAYLNARDFSAAAPNPSLRFLTADVQRMIITNAGRVGIGTPNPSYTLDVHAKEWGNAVRAVDDAAMGTGFGAGVVYAVKYTTAGELVDVAVVRGAKLNSTSGDRAGKMLLQVVDSAGNWVNAAELRPGSMTFNGNAHFNGAVTGTSIAAHFQDVAEWVPSRTDLEAGTVVVLDAQLGNGVRACTRAYDTTVAGVISDEPGIILGVAGAEKERVATTGRVLVRVDASAGPISVGDLLVTSDRPGHAMKSVPVNVSGVALHRPGTIVGKALESLSTGEGQILVLLSLQ